MITDVVVEIVGDNQILTRIHNLYLEPTSIYASIQIQYIRLYIRIEKEKKIDDINDFFLACVYPVLVYILMQHSRERERVRERERERLSIFYITKFETLKNAFLCLRSKDKHTLE